jgi:hypothetical protein
LSLFARVPWLPAAALCAACSSNSSVPAAVPMRPPTPTSVTIHEPGGDAEDPERAALERLLGEEWGARPDRDDQLLAPMPDAEHWRRTRYWGFEHLVGFRYGSEHRAMIAVGVRDLPPGTPVKSETCMKAFEDWARPQIAGFDVKLSPFVTKVVRWRDQPLVIQSIDGWVSWGIGSSDFSAAWAAYPAYKDACLIYGVAIPWRGQPELAKRVRDRWLNEGFTTMQVLTVEKAYRHEREPDAPPPAATPPDGSAPQAETPAPVAPLDLAKALKKIPPLTSR